MYTVTFDPAGGDVSVTAITVTYSQEYGPLPIPTRAGYAFLGWFTGEGDSGTRSQRNQFATQALTTICMHTGPSIVLAQ